MTLHHVPNTKSAPGRYVARRESSTLFHLRFYRAGAGKFTFSSLLQDVRLRTLPIVHDEVTG